MSVSICVCVCVCMCNLQCPTICDSMDSSPEGSSVHGILQARILEWVTMTFSRGSSRPRDSRFSHVFCIGRQILYHWTTREASTAIPSSISLFVLTPPVPMSPSDLTSMSTYRSRLKSIHFHVYTKRLLTGSITVDKLFHLDPEIPPRVLIALVFLLGHLFSSFSFSLPVT